MQFISSLLLFLFLINPLSLKASLEQGQNFGKQMLNQSGSVAAKIKPEEVVSQYTANPEEASLGASDLDGKVVSSLQKNPSAKLIEESEQNRGKFLKIHEDPLVSFSKELSADPLGLLSKYYKDCREVLVEESSEKPKTQSYTCEEAGSPYLLTCKRDLHVQTIRKERKYARSRIQGSMFKRYWVSGNPQYSNRYISRYGHDGQYNLVVQDPNLAETNWRFFDGCNWYYHRVTNEYTYAKGFSGESQSQISLTEYNSTQLQSNDIREQWTSTCDTLEEKIDSGLCQYIEKKCTQGKAARTINGFPVTKNCWQETYTYQCTVPSKNDCEGLRAQGCRQTNSQCKKFIGKDCVLYIQTFECTDLSSLKGQGVKTKIVCGEAPQCLSGNCVEQGYPLNNEMLQVMAQMSILKELQNQVKDGVPEIFRGEDNRCSRNIADFRDCCGSGGGWGTSLNLASCSSGEKALSLKRQKKQCHTIGTYCAKKVLGICVEKKTTFCCFGSSFLRTIQEQARSQIKLGWGGAENPVCRGLTVEELSKVDFSKLDLSEIFQDISARYKQPQNETMGKHLQSRMKVIEESLKTDPQAKQRKEG